MDLITVAEFAQIIGVKKAEAYKLIKEEKYRDFVVVKDGQKYIDSLALDAVNSDKQQSEPEAVPELTSLKAEVAQLKAQLAEKDEQIFSLAGRLADLAEAQQELTRSALTTAQQAHYLAIGAPTDDKTEAEADTVQKRRFPWFRKK